MVDRVSTAGVYSAILANLSAAENREVNAENRVSSTKNGNSLRDYANQAATLTAIKSVDARVTNYQAQNSQIAAKLVSQDGGLTSIADSATAVRQAIADALASGDGTSLIQVVQGQFQTAVSGLNTQFDGKYLFAGGQVLTIEPGLYWPGIGGVRHEDVIVVTETAYDLLSRFPKPLEV